MYKEKYIKYKKKYLELSQRGGINCNMLFNFNQHRGECWHDSLLTIIFFSEPLGDRIQKIIKSHEDIDYFFTLPNDFLLPINIDKDEFIKYSAIFRTYLSNIKDRYINKNQQIIQKLKPLAYKEPPPPPALTRQISEKCSIDAVRAIKDITDIKQDLIRKGSGGDTIDSIITIQLINYFFQEENKFINFESVDNPLSSNLLNLTNFYKVNAICINLNNDTDKKGHVVSLFKCNGTCMYYDDNGIYINSDDLRIHVIEFNWEQLFNEYIKHNLLSKLYLDLLKKIKDLYNGYENFSKNNYHITGILLLEEDTYINEIDYYNKIIPRFETVLHFYDYYYDFDIYKRLYSKENTLIRILNYGQLYKIKIDPKLKTDEDFLFKAIKHNASAWDYAVKSLKENKKFIIDAIELNTNVLINMEKTIKQNSDIMLEAITHNPIVFKYIEENLVTKEFVSDAIIANNEILIYNEKILKKMFPPSEIKSLYIMLISKEPSILPKINKSEIDDEIIKKAILNNIKVIEYLDSKHAFRNDPKFMLVLIKKDENTLLYASDKLKENSEFMLRAMAIYNEAKLKEFSQKKYLNQEEYSLKKKEYYNLLAEFFSKNTGTLLKGNKDFMLAAMKIFIFAIKYIHPSLKADKDFILKAMVIDKGAIRYANPSLQAEISK